MTVVMIPNLEQSVHDGSFFKASRDTILLTLRDAFPEELNRLTRAYGVDDPTSERPSLESPSRFLYGREFIEVNRTLVSILSLCWIANGDYDAFAGLESTPVRLSRESFDWMRSLLDAVASDPTDRYALLISVMINDLGKDPQLAQDVCRITGEDISDMNHDMILLKAVHAGLVPCLDALSPHHRSEVLLGITLSADFNFGQLAQAENAPACLAPLWAIKGQERAFNLRFMEQLLDLAGAAGADDWTFARTLSEPVFRVYLDTYHVAKGVLRGEYSLRQGYDVVLSRKAVQLHDRGFKMLDVHLEQDRALLRLFCMGRVSNLDMAQFYDEVYWELDVSVRDSLTRSLNVDGSKGNPAIQPTYMPALVNQAVRHGRLKSRHDGQRALLSALRYMNRVMERHGNADESATVIERNVFNVFEQYVRDPTFLDNVDVLDTAPIPKDVVAQRQ